MKWPAVRLSSVADLCLGKMLDKAKNKGNLRPYLANINVRWGALDLQDLREMRFEDRELERYGLMSGDIVMCEGGEPGRCVLWRDQAPGAMIQKALHRVRPAEGVDSQFLYYSLFHKGRSGGLDQYFTGATIKHLPGEQLAKVEVTLPPLATQRRIASILGAYDDLIEVNRRRVAVLEEMARGLFEEWFVRFRFPGHESVPIVDTPDGPLPEGWAWQPFSQLAQFINGYAFKPSDFEGDGLPIIKIPELKKGISAKTPRNSGENVPKLLHVETGDLLFSWSGTLAISEWTGGLGLLNQHLFLVVPKGRVSRGLLREALRASLPRFDLQGVGATMKHIRRSALDNVAVALPGSDQVMERADAAFCGFYNQIVVLRQQNAALAASRDLLLPRLLSGQLSVEATERELEFAA